MTNFSLVIDSKFDPFTYQELLHPVMTATQAHQTLEDQYNTLSTEAATVGEMANEQTDPEAYKAYKKYEADLQGKANELAKVGLSPTSRQGMLNLRTRYAQEINPIKVAYNRRKELADEQRKMLATNPTMLYQRMAKDISLDDLIKNPELDYGQQYSGALITQQVATAASNIAKEARDSEEGRRKLRQLIPYQYELVRQNGFSREAVEKAILGSKDADKILTGLVDNAIATSGVNTWGDAATRARALDYARQGLYSAIGTTDYQQITDQAGLQRLSADLQDMNAKRAEQRAAARAAADAGNALAQTRGNLPIDIHNLVSPNALGADANKAASEAAKFFRLGSKGKAAMQLHGVGVMDAGQAVTATNKNGQENKFNIWNKNGTLMTRYQFTQQGKTAEDRRRLGLFYDRDVTKHAAALGWNLKDLAKQGKVPSVNNFQWGARNIGSISGPLTMGALRINFKDNNKVLQNLLPILTFNEDETQIKEITSFDKKGKIQDNGKIIKLDTFLDGEGKLKGTPAFFAPPNANTNGVILQFRGKSYLIPRERLGSLSNTAYKVDVPTLRNAQQQKQQLIATYGESTYYSSQVGQALEQVINNSGADYLRAMYNTLGWQADAPTYDVNFNSQTQIP